MTIPQLLTVEEIATIVRATPGAIYQQRYRGEQPGSLGVRVGRRILFRPDDIERYLDEERESQLAHLLPSRL